MTSLEAIGLGARAAGGGADRCFGFNPAERCRARSPAPAAAPERPAPRRAAIYHATASGSSEAASTAASELPSDRSTRAGAIGWKADELYPQQSVSKLWVSITALDAVDKGRVHLDDKVTLSRDDLTLFHQPIAAMILGGGYTTTLDDLMFKAITTSDNTATTN